MGGSVQQNDCTIIQANFTFPEVFSGAFVMMGTTLLSALYLKEKKIYIKKHQELGQLKKKKKPKK